MFSADDSKKSITIWAKYLSTSQRSYLAFRKYYVLLGFELPLARYQSLKMQDCNIFFVDLAFF